MLQGPLPTDLTTSHTFYAATFRWLGWSKPLATLNGANFNPGASSSQTFNVPALTTSDTDFIMVVPSAWMGMAGAPIFVSYRAPVGSDAGLQSQFKVGVEMSLIEKCRPINVCLPIASLFSLFTRSDPGAFVFPALLG